MVYEIGRYYLSAAILGAMRNDGILALRSSLALWMGVGLAMAIALVGHGWRENRWTRLVAPTLLISVWMTPRHKIFDIAISVVLLAAIAHVLARPVPEGYSSSDSPPAWRH